jgi:hypothetical protein
MQLKEAGNELSLPNGVIILEYACRDWVKPLKTSIRLTKISSEIRDKKKLKLNSMVWVRERTIPTERPPLVSEVIANFCG